MPHAAVENTFFAQADGLNIAVMVKDGKGLAILQHAGAGFSRRSPARYVVLLGDANLFQLKSP